MKKERGIWIDAKGYVWIRLWPFGYRHAGTGAIQPPYLEYVGLYSPAVMEVAQERLLELRLQILRKTFSLAPKEVRMTFAEACDLYYEKHGQSLGSKADVRHVLSFAQGLFPDKFIDEMGKLHIEKFREACKQRGNAPTSIDRKQAILTSLFGKLAWWVKTEEIKKVKLPEYNPGTLVKDEGSTTDSTDTKVYTPEEFEALLANATTRGRKIYLFAINSLLRKKDLSQLRGDQVNRYTGVVRGFQCKTKKPYLVIINAVTKQILAEAESERVLDFTNFQTEFNMARKGAGITDGDFKAIRRTGATWLYLDGVDLKTISQMLGHTTTAQTEAYIGVIPKNLIEASRKMEKRFIPAQNPDFTVVNTVVKNDSEKSTDAIISTLNPALFPGGVTVTHRPLDEDKAPKKD